MATGINKHGNTYEFGIQDSDAPSIAGFAARSADVEYQPEVLETAQDGEGHTDAVAVSKPEKAMATVTVSGYINDINAYRGVVGGTFSFLSRFWIIGSVTEPRQKGKFVEGSVKATSWAGVTS